MRVWLHQGIQAAHSGLDVVVRKITQEPNIGEVLLPSDAALFLARGCAHVRIDQALRHPESV